MSHSESIAVKKTNLQQVKTHEILLAFQQCKDEIKVLSLDCFDTLLWRTTNSPRDVFFNLQNKEPFKKINFTTRIREEGETIATQLNFIKSNTKQVTLYDIYQAIYPDFNPQQIDELVEAELAEEIQVCYAFQPIIKLICLAKSEGKKIIIVSDTYLSETQLRRLLAAKLPQDIMSMIDKVFCSSQYGTGKADYLFDSIIQSLKVSPQQIMHVGDNATADFQVPKKYGMHAFHFLQQSTKINDMLRVQNVCAGFIDPRIRSTHALNNPFAALISEKAQGDNAASLIGYVAIGPILYAFAKYLLAEIDLLSQTKKNIKTVFLMRDAYLPALVCDTIAQKKIGSHIHISRFATLASSFRCKDDIDHYVAENISSFRFKDMCVQLLLPQDVAERFCEQSMQSPDPMQKFASLIRNEAITKEIITQSTHYRARLIKYLKNEIGLTHGDTLLFVDLGYTGTTQIKLSAIFHDEMNIEIIGRYFICLRSLEANCDRSGLLNFDYYEDNVLRMLVRYIALFEQMCAASVRSIIDFDDAGVPIHSDISVGNTQFEKLQLIQDECLRFAQDAEIFFQENSVNITPKMLRDTAAVNLARFLFLPTKPEIQYLQSFNHDVNLGTKEVFPVFDLDKGLLQLRRRSWLFGIKDSNEHLRMNYPAEWRAANLELSLALMAQHRFDFSVAAIDLSFRSEKVPAIFSDGINSFQNSFEALLTHDGFYSLIVPIMNRHEIGLQFGILYQWIELECVDVVELNALYSHQESRTMISAEEFITVKDMVARGGNLFECQSEHGMLIFVPPKQDFQKQMLLRIVFRPTVSCPR